jgi:hypothetical protein
MSFTGYVPFKGYVALEPIAYVTSDHRVAGSSPAGRKASSGAD